jgi:hypothetical protein
MKKSEIIDSVLKTSVESRCISKVAMDKYAAYPAIFLQLENNSKRAITNQYAVGPQSEVSEISIDQVTKKPYTEQLVVYTISTLTEKEQNQAQKDKYKMVDDYERNDEEYKKFRGSMAGNEMLEKKKIEIKDVIDKQYTPTEKPVAWGVGTYFTVNQKLFSWHYGRGRGGHSRSDAPGNRKELIAYIKANGGKVYAIAADPTVAEKRKDRMQNKDYNDPKIKVFQERAKAIGAKKIVELDKVIDDYLKISKTNALVAFESYFNKNISEVKEGKAYGISDFTYKFKMLDKIAEAYRYVKGSSNPVYYSSDVEDAKKALLQYIAELDNIIAKVKKVVDESKETAAN